MTIHPVSRNTVLTNALSATEDFLAPRLRTPPPAQAAFMVGTQFTGHAEMEPTKTTSFAEQERTCQRVPATTEELRTRACAGPWLELSLERRPDPDSGDMSEADAAWPQRLRRIARASLTYWRRPDLVDTVELLLTELATNALRHARGQNIGVRIFAQDDHLVIEVNDGSPLTPVPRCAGPNDESGRGLFLVEALSDTWGVSLDGTTTWCTLPLTEGPPT
ncbi:ATP-binding protein [Streptomyces sp. HO565]|uniref:ATP-binding protein n=1 Tax=Streptomyces sp. HO565 TaxID=2857489 RepID=UPI0038B480E1